MKNQNINPHTLSTPSPKPPNPDSNSQYNYPHQFITAYGTHLRTQFTPTGLGRTKQSFKNECDINQIMARFLRTGVMDFTQKNEPRYGDCTGWDFQAAMQVVAKAESMFAELPAELRDRFNNKPSEFLDFVNDRRNLEEARELGLLRPAEKVATPVPTPPSSDAPTPPLASRSDMKKQARADGERKAAEE